MAAPKPKAMPETLIAKPHTAADHVADALREKIVAGTLRGGEVLRQDELAEQFGISRMPIRDALRQLETDGLVTVHPTRGCFVAPLKSKEIKEIYALRELLECEALRLAFPTYTPAVLDDAKDLLAKIDSNASFGSLNSLNSAFHMTLYKGCNNARLINLIEALHRSSDRYVCMFMAHEEYGEVSQVQHRDILSACEQGNRTLAVKALKLHLSKGSKKLVDHFS